MQASAWLCVRVWVDLSTYYWAPLPWLLLILPYLHQLEYLFSLSLTLTHTLSVFFSQSLSFSLCTFQGQRSVGSDLCVCPHMHLLCGLEAQMYTHPVFEPAVKLQQGLKDPPLWPLRTGLQETHTHPYIHNVWSVILQETAQGNSCQARADYFPPYFLFLHFPPSSLSAPQSSSPRCLHPLIFLLRPLHWLVKHLEYMLCQISSHYFVFASLTKAIYVLHNNVKCNEFIFLAHKLYSK